MPAPSWDLAIIVFFLIGIAFGYILQREKIVATLLSVYVALIVTKVFAGNVFDFLQGSKTIGDTFVNSGASPFTVRAIIFMAVIMLLSAKGGISGTKSKGIMSPIEIFGLSFLTTGLILTSLFYFMPPESRDAFMANSRMATLVIKYYVWWIIVPVVVMIALGFLGRKSSSSSSD